MTLVGGVGDIMTRRIFYNGRLYTIDYSNQTDRIDNKILTHIISIVSVDLNVLNHPLTMHYEDDNRSILELVKITIDRYSAGENGVIDKLIEFKTWQGDLSEYEG